MATAAKVLPMAWGAALNTNGQAVGVRLRRTRKGLAIADLVSIDLQGWQTPFLLGKTPLCAAVSSVMVHSSEGTLFPSSATSSEISPDTEFTAWCQTSDIDFWADSFAGSLTQSIPELSALGLSARLDPQIPASYMWAHFENDQLCVGVVDNGKGGAAQRVTTSEAGCLQALNRFIRYARQGSISTSCFTTLVWLGSGTSMPAFPVSTGFTVVQPEIRFRNQTLHDRSQLSALGAACALTENVPVLHFSLPTTLPGFHALRVALVNTVRWVVVGALLAALLGLAVWLGVSVHLHDRLAVHTKYQSQLAETSRAVDSLNLALSSIKESNDRFLRLTPHIKALAQAMAPGITLDQIGTDPIAATKSMRCTLAGTATDEALVTKTLENLQKTKNIVQVSLSSLQARQKPSTGVSFIIVCVLQ